MRTFSKLVILGAALTVSTSLAYADTLGSGQINFMGNDEFTSNSITFEGQQTVGSSYDSLAPFGAGEVALFTNLSSFSSLPSTYFFQVSNSTDTLDFYLTSATGTSGTYVPYVGGPTLPTLTLDGTGYFTESANGGGIIATSTPGAITLTTQGDLVTTFSASAFVTPTATPEPTSLLLLGTGLLGAAGVARRKFASKLI